MYLSYQDVDLHTDWLTCVMKEQILMEWMNGNAPDLANNTLDEAPRFSHHAEMYTIHRSIFLNILIRCLHSIRSFNFMSFNQM
ncbi:uncharacterized protein OCT59_000445 [Rhizophagus irregularis]|uniref:uncharacterized protein n=1 Tax=Rhizophagus irregularis TaxID=588596 RepID=UPI0019EF994C|nr:hypothetical protein OCT59_000445 [Rhizophagus irregularis]GBC47943.2 hypothetical protein RIR_jg18450.t1 [Rhizophagus irregularis DAOM 181602=DAOM 197198]